MAGQENTQVMTPPFMRFFLDKASFLFPVALVAVGIASPEALAVETDIDSAGDGTGDVSEEDTNEHEHHYVIEYFNGRTRGGRMVTIYQCLCGAKQYNYYA